MTMKRGALAAFVLLGAWSGSASAQTTATAPVPTFNKDVAPILYANCTTCHRPGEIAPMSLMTFKDVRPWARAIAAKVADGTMPPWHADPAYGSFVNERRLSDAQKSVIDRWAKGCPRGRHPWPSDR